MVNDAETVSCDKATQAHANRKYKRNEHKFAIICLILTFFVSSYFGVIQGGWPNLGTLQA